MSTTAPAPSTQYIEERIAPLRKRLATHPIYTQVKTIAHIRTFMELHVFAVWDFMSLLTALRQKLTCVSVPWLPTRWPDSRRFLNEIALGEESDSYEGRPLSHFELYLEAMDECGADTRSIRHLISEMERARPGTPISELMERAAVPHVSRRFVQTTFDVIESESLIAVAAGFTFGREDLIPPMFRELARDISNDGSGRLNKFVWYLERHIELDGDDHGPLSLKIITDLCGSDVKLWDHAADAAEEAMSARLSLWDGILESLLRRDEAERRR